MQRTKMKLKMFIQNLRFSFHTIIVIQDKRFTLKPNEMQFTLKCWQSTQSVLTEQNEDVSQFVVRKVARIRNQ